MKQGAGPTPHRVPRAPGHASERPQHPAPHGTPSHPPRLTRPRRPQAPSSCRGGGRRGELGAGHGRSAWSIHPGSSSASSAAAGEQRQGSQPSASGPCQQQPAHEGHPQLPSPTPRWRATRGVSSTALAKPHGSEKHSQAPAPSALPLGFSGKCLKSPQQNLAVMKMQRLREREGSPAPAELALDFGEQEE